MIKMNWNKVGMYGLVGLIASIIMQLNVRLGEVKWTIMKAILAGYDKIIGLSPISGININFAALEINVGGSVTGLEGGLGQWFSQAFGFSVPGMGLGPFGPIGLPEGFLMVALGVAALFAIGAAIVIATGYMKGKKNAQVFYVLLAGHLAAMFMLNGGFPDLSIGTAEVFIALGINLAVMTWILTSIDEYIVGGKLIPA